MNSNHSIIIHKLRKGALPARVRFLQNLKERPLPLFGGAGAFTFVTGLLTLILAWYGLLSAKAESLGSLAMCAAVPLFGAGVLLHFLEVRHKKQESAAAANPKPVPAATASPSEPIRKLTGPGPLVLVADDNRVTRSIFRSQLTREGFRVAEANSSAEAVAKIDRETTAVLLDVNAPGGKGLHTLRDIRHRYPHLRVIITSADEDLETTVIASKLGAFDTLTKHPTREAILDVVNRAAHPKTDSHIQRSVA